MRPLSQELKQLNEDTFRAEERKDIKLKSGGTEDWKPFLQRVLLAPDFRLVRGSGKVSQKDEMINEIAASNPSRREIDPPQGYEEGDLGVVICVIRLPDDPNPDNQRDSFQNIKVFVRREDEWKCAYWQVTRLPKG